MTTDSTTVPDRPASGGDRQILNFHQVSIDLARCDGCMICVAVCPVNVLELVGPVEDRKAQVKADWTGCMSCNNCLAVCSSQAIRATKPYDFPGPRAQQRIGEFSLPRNF